MPVVVTLDTMLQRRGLTGKQLAGQMGMSETQLSLFRSGKVRGIRFATVARMCALLECVPGDLLDYCFDAVDLAPPIDRETGTPDRR